MVGYPETGQGAVVMINGTDYWDLVHEIIRWIAVEYSCPNDITEHVLKVDPKIYGELAGRYGVKGLVMKQNDFLIEAKRVP